MKTIVKVLFGSNLYGTNTPSSDKDYKSVFIPDPKDILLGTVRKSVTVGSKYDREKQVDGKISRNLATDEDTEQLELKHFLSMVAEGQTMSLDILFAVNESLLENSLVWEQLRTNRHRLVTKKVTKTVEYINTQSKKYGVKGSRVAECRRLRDLFKSLMEDKPSGKVQEVGDYIKALTRRDWHHTSIIEIEQPSGLMLEHLECVGRKIPFTVSVKEAFLILDNFMQKYGQRALDVENNQGVDWKALSHAVRIARQALEFLDTGNITFPRPDAEELKTIKRGDLPFVQVSELITDLTQEVREAAEKSKLPEEVDQEWIDNFIIKHYKDAVVNM